MLFNFGNCKCLHTGPGSTAMNYEMGATILYSTVKEKYLGATMNANMKVLTIAAYKGNQARIQLLAKGEVVINYGCRS